MSLEVDLESMVFVVSESVVSESVVSESVVSGSVSKLPVSLS